MTRIGIIAGSNRPGALNPQVVAWVKAQLDEAGVENAVVDYNDYDLPILDEEIPGGAHAYANEHTKAWGAAVEPFDGYIVVTPEYNHGVPGPLKNAIDYIGSEFNNKPVAFAS
jgi:NAD(P)H-dependent FMN reductase